MVNEQPRLAPQRMEVIDRQGRDVVLQAKRLVPFVHVGTWRGADQKPMAHGQAEVLLDLGDRADHQIIRLVVSQLPFCR